MEKYRVLLITGEVTSEHDYPKMNENLRTMLQATGMFTVKIIEEFYGCTKKTLVGYDLILLNYDGKKSPVDSYRRWDEEAEDALFDFVEQGGGIFVHHSAAWLDEELPERYKKMWGYYLVGGKSRRNPHPDVLVRTTVPDHPIMWGIDRFMIVSDDFFAGVEKYPDSEAKVLAVAYDDLAEYEKVVFPPPHHPVLIPEGKLELMPGVNTEQPVTWTNTYGRGRVFVCSLGHDIDTYRRMDYLTMFVRGAEWAASGNVTLDKPDRSGERRFRPWPYY